MSNSTKNYLVINKIILLLCLINCVLCNTEYLIYTKSSFQSAAESISSLHSVEVPAELQLHTEILYNETLDSDGIEINDYIEIKILENPNLKYLLIIGDENVIAPQYFYGTATDDLFSKEIINNYPIPKLITGRIIASNNDEAEFQIKHSMDERYYQISFCPFCSEELSRELEDEIEWREDDE